MPPANPLPQDGTTTRAQSHTPLPPMPGIDDDKTDTGGGSMAQPPDKTTPSEIPRVVAERIIQPDPDPDDPVSP